MPHDNPHNGQVPNRDRGASQHVDTENVRGSIPGDGFTMPDTGWGGGRNGYDSSFEGYGDRRSRDDRYSSRRGYDRARVRTSETLNFLGYMISETIAVPASAEKLLKLSQWVHVSEGNSVRAEHWDVPMPVEWYTIVGIMACARNAPTSTTIQALLDVYVTLFEIPSA